MGESCVCGIYESVLVIFKKFVMRFQSEKPLIHKIYPEQLNLVKTFSYFVKPDVLKSCSTAKDLKTLDLSPKNILKSRIKNELIVFENLE